MHDPVNSPKHYTDGGFIHEYCKEPIEVIDITRNLSFTRGNAVKYILRADLKDCTIDDLKKAVWYLNDEIGRLEAMDEAEDVPLPAEAEEDDYVVQPGALADWHVCATLYPEDCDCS